MAWGLGPGATKRAAVEQSLEALKKLRHYVVGETLGTSPREDELLRLMMEIVQHYPNEKLGISLDYQKSIGATPELKRILRAKYEK